MFEVLISNISFIFILVVIYLVSLGLNTALGVYYNVNTLKEKFSKEKLLSGLIKGGIILFGTLGITAIISMVPSIVAALGIATGLELFESISITGIGTVFVASIAKYLADAVKKLYAILKNQNKEEA